jgi:hypothetical protein
MQTAKDRFRRALVSISQWWKAHRHDPLKMQQKDTWEQMARLLKRYPLARPTPARRTA